MSKTKTLDTKTLDTKNNITISNNILFSFDCSVIPVFLKTLTKTNTLFNYVSKYISISKNYKQIIEQIENNMINNNMSMSSLTVEYSSSSNSSNSNSSNTTTNDKHLTKKQIHNQTQSKYKLKHKSKHKSSSTQTQLGGVMKHVNSKIHQLYLIAIKSSDDLLELARVSGTALFNTLKNNKMHNINIINTYDKSYEKIITKQNEEKKENAKMDNAKMEMDETPKHKVMFTETKFIEALVEGLLLSSYSFTKYKTNHSLSKTKDKCVLYKINIVIKKTLNTNIFYKRLKDLKTQIKCVFLARDLVNEPANATKTDLFINIINKFIKENNIPVSIEILDKQDLEKLGMGLILGVGRGSSKENEPKMIILKYDGKQSGKKSGKVSGKQQPDYVLVGKGITFDTGGLDIKDSGSMLEMKTDLAGASTVITFLLGYAMNKGNRCIYSICPFAENSVGPNSIKPSDVLRAYNGSTVEITNTDAEGRLIIADTLAYIVDKYPKASIIDFATLTGAQVRLSCKMFSNILAVNSSIEVAKLIEAGEEINELLVELPMMEKHLKYLESYVADIQNVSTTCSAGIIMSALFMRQFVKKHTKWIHIDIAGPSYKADNVIKYGSPEATGVGVRLLFNYFE